MAKVAYRRKITEWQPAHYRLQTVVQKTGSNAEMNCRNRAVPYAVLCADRWQKNGSDADELLRKEFICTILVQNQARIIADYTHGRGGAANPFPSAQSAVYLPFVEKMAQIQKPMQNAE